MDTQIDQQTVDQSARQTNAEQPDAEQSNAVNAVSGRCMTICKEFKINDSITIPCWCVKIADDNGPETIFLRGHDIGTLMGYSVSSMTMFKRVEQICNCTWGDLRNIPSSSKSLKAPLHWRAPHVFVALQNVESLVRSSTKKPAKYFRKLFGESNAGSRPNAEQAYVDTPAEQPQTTVGQSPVGLNSEQSNDEQANDEQLPTLSIAGPVSGRYMELVKAYFKVNDSEIFPCWIVKIVYDNGLEEYWFLGHDVAEFLGYELPNKAIYDHVETRWKCIWDDLRNIPSGSKSLKVPPNWQPHSIFVSEAGLYELILNSKLELAKTFKYWVMEDLLPSLRRDGFNQFTEKHGKALEESHQRNQELTDGLLHANRDLVQARQDSEQARRVIELARQDAELARQDSELARRDTEQARKDSVQMYNQLAVIIPDVVYKPRNPELRQVLLVSDLGNREIAFTRCQFRYETRQKTILKARYPLVKCIYRNKYTPNAVHDLIELKARLKDRGIKFASKGNNIVKILDDTDLQEVISLIPQRPDVQLKSE